MNTIIAMGSNQDYRGMTPIEILSKAILKLEDRKIRISAKSRFFESPAFPDKDNPKFINCVITAIFFGSPAELLSEVNEVEKELGRVRDERWGIRTCDLDIITIDNLVLPNLLDFNYWANISLNKQLVETPKELIIPHPRLQDRAFVLKPLLDIVKKWKHPVFEKTALELLNNLPNWLKDSVKEIK